MSATDSDLYELAMSDEAQPLMAAVKNHIAKNVEPITEEFYALDAEKTDRWSWHPRQLELLEGAKSAAKDAGRHLLLRFSHLQEVPVAEDAKTSDRFFLHRGHRTPR